MNNNDFSIKTAAVLKKLHIGPHRKGYMYLKELLEIMNDSKHTVLQDIYNIIAKRYRVSPGSIETAIRRAIREGITECPNKVKFEVFSYDVMVDNRANRDYYKTKEFVLYVLEYLQSI